MGYRTRPRYQARLERRQQPRQSFSAAEPAGRWEPSQVLDALNDMHNAPQRDRVGAAVAGAQRERQGGG